MAVISGVGRPIEGSGLHKPLIIDIAPVDGTSGTFAGICPTGAQVISTLTAKLYVNTGTQSSPTWTVVGTQV